jgi:signal transduction histidine kinase
VTTSVSPRLYREPGRRRLAGVATGIADHLQLRVSLVRMAFVALALAGGLGVALYGAYWIVLPTRGSTGRRLPQWLELVIAAVIVLIVAGALADRASSVGGLFVPTLLACLGGALIWRQASESERDRWLQLGRSSMTARTRDRVGTIRLVAGAVLVLAGALVVLLTGGVASGAALGSIVLAVVVTLVGVALITGPWWMRLVSELGAERAERIRSQERADIAAQLHDSVLQTLALIQRNSTSPRDVVRLARGQERELRSLLYGVRVASGHLGAELRRAAAEVEDAYVVRVDVVVVGEIDMDEHLAAVVAAAREAMVNAAKHSGTASVSLYAEVEDDAVSVFVKDRGRGFDVGAVAADRHGVRDSIVGRIERHGGTVDVRSSAGAGVDVAIRMPRTIS